MLNRVFMAVSAFIFSMALVYSHPCVSSADESIAVENNTERSVVLSWYFNLDHLSLFEKETLKSGQVSKPRVLREVQTMHVFFQDNNTQHNYKPQSADIKDGKIFVSQMTQTIPIAVMETKKPSVKCSIL